MKDFENMTYEELLQVQAQVKSALVDSREKAIKEKVNKVVKAIDELCYLIEKLKGDSMIPCIRLAYGEALDLHEYKSFLNDDCFDFSALFDSEEE